MHIVKCADMKTSYNETAKLMLGIMIDRRINDDLTLGDPINEYEYGDTIGSFKPISGTVYTNSMPTVFYQHISTLANQVNRKNQSVNYSYCAGGSHTDQFVFVFDNTKPTSQDMELIDGHIHCGNFTWKFRPLNEVPLSDIEMNDRSNLKSVSSIIHDTDEIFNLPHLYKSLNYPTVKDLICSDRLLTPIFYSLTYGAASYLLMQKNSMLEPTRAGGIGEEFIGWIKWEHTNPLKCVYSKNKKTMANSEPYCLNERRYCAFTGIEIYGDCYIIEFYDNSEDKKEYKTYQIIVSPYGYHNYNNYDWLVTKHLVFRTKSPVTLKTILSEEVQDENTRNLLLDLEASTRRISPELWEAVIGGEKILCIYYNSLKDILDDIQKYKESRILYMKHNRYD